MIVGPLQAIGLPHSVHLLAFAAAEPSGQRVFGLPSVKNLLYIPKDAEMDGTN